MILDERGKKYVLKPGHDFQSDLGIVKAEVLDPAEVGDEVKSHLDHTFKIMKPNINDFIDIMDRRCSILIQKDIGQVLAHTGLGYGSRVVDAGTGAGAIALNFGNVVGPEGRVFTYEIREDFAEVAQKNIDNFGITNIEVKNKDIKEGIDEDNIDLVFLDLPKPFEILDGCAFMHLISIRQKSHTAFLRNWVFMILRFLKPWNVVLKFANRV